jgi:hypothetical protein
VRVVSPSRTPTRLAIRTHPDYKTAQSLFTQGKRTEAKQALAGLLALPHLTAADKAFLTRQIALCDEPASSVPSTLPLAPPRTPEDTRCGARALALAVKEMGMTADVSALAKAAGTDASGANLAGLEKAAQGLGLRATSVQVDRDALANLPTPAVGWWEGNHYVAVTGIHQNLLTGDVSATVHDPNDAEAKTLPLNDLLAKSGGIFLTLKRR